MVKPKEISEAAVLTQAIIVRSWASRVRSTANSVEVDVGGADAFTTHPDYPRGKCVYIRQILYFRTVNSVFE